MAKRVKEVNLGFAKGTSAQDVKRRTVDQLAILDRAGASVAAVTIVYTNSPRKAVTKSTKVQRRAQPQSRAADVVQQEV